MILVTGVAGFIGSHLAERLIGDGFEVLGVDSFFNYYPRRIKEGNLAALLGNPKFKFIEASLFNLNLREIVAGVEGVFHQAALPGVRASWGEYFSEYVENNVRATQVLLEACKDSKTIRKFVYASSSSVYGDADEMPIRETSPTNPVSPYGVTKLAAEHLSTLYSKGYGVPAVSLRYFTVYGPRQRPDMGFHKFISRIVRGEELEIFGDGSQTRDFTYVDDAVEANIRAFHNGKNGESYNIGGGSRINLLDTIRIIEEVSDRRARLKFVAPQRGDAKHTFADVTKAARDFGYAPKVATSEGLRRHWEWLRDNIGIYS
ncbi:MAG: NAD-dependent epimerase/dehydratase family protein [Deltaproteobacteria bacterium]